MCRGELGAGGSDDLFRLLKGGKEAIGFMWDWSFFFPPYHYPLIAPSFFPVSFCLPAILFISLLHYLLFALISPPPPPLVFSFRALFLGLSNNPHITDLHLDISSCEVRSICAALGKLTHLLHRLTPVVIPSCPTPLSHPPTVEVSRGRGDSGTVSSSFMRGDFRHLR